MFSEKVQQAGLCLYKSWMKSTEKLTLTIILFKKAYCPDITFLKKVLKDHKVSLYISFELLNYSV